MYPVFSHMYTDNNNDNNNKKNNINSSNNNNIYIYIVCETASIFSSQQSKRYIYSNPQTLRFHSHAEVFHMKLFHAVSS